MGTDQDLESELLKDEEQIKHRAEQIRESKQLYRDIPEGSRADYFDALQTFSTYIRTLTTEAFADIHKRRGEHDATVKTESKWKL